MNHTPRVGPVGDTVRHNIRHLRYARRRSLRTLSEDLAKTGHKLSANAILQTEQGLRRLNVDDLAAFATVLGVTPGQLLEPPTDCAACHDTPPAGFTCRACRTEA